MEKYRVKVVVEYDYDVEAESYKEAEDMGWHFEDYPYASTVREIDIEQYEEEED
jgi:hypothetical protein